MTTFAHFINNSPMYKILTEKARITVLLGLIPFLTCFFLESSFSQDFEVAPAKLVYDCEPGQIQTKTLTVRNHSTQKQQFSLTLADAQVDTAGHTKADVAKLKKEKSCKDWITINPPFFELNPNESYEAKVMMQVPPGQSSTRWAMLYVSAVEEQTAIGSDKQMKTGLDLKPRIGVRVTQSPKSNMNFKGAISDLKEITQKQDTIRTFNVKISNTGDKILEGKIHLVLSNLETAKEIKAKPIKTGTIYPGNAKKMNLTLPQNVPAGKYSMAAILDFGNNSALEAVQMTIEVK